MNVLHKSQQHRKVSDIYEADILFSALVMLIKYKVLLFSRSHCQKTRGKPFMLTMNKANSIAKLIWDCYAGSAWQFFRVPAKMNGKMVLEFLQLSKEVQRMSILLV